MNPSEGRVPVSWNECADWLDAGQLVWFVYDPSAPRLSHRSAETFRDGTPEHERYVLSDYRLLPPPGLVAAPGGMDGGGWLGQGKDVPDGWEWRLYANAGRPFIDDMRSYPDALVQCRPPVPKREPEWVPFSEAFGRVVAGCKETIGHIFLAPGTGLPSGFRSSHYDPWINFPDGTLDLDTGRVKVEPEGEQ